MSETTHDGAPAGERNSTAPQALSTAMTFRAGRYVSRLAHRKLMWRGVLRAVAGVLLLAVILSTARQTNTPAPLYSEIVREADTDAVPRRTVDWPGQFAWLSKDERKKYAPLEDRLREPPGFTRVKAAPGSFAEWLRRLPVLPEGSAVKSAKGQVIRPADDPRLAAVIALQPRGEKLLDGINIILRLRAEYLWAAEKTDRAAFHFTSGHLATWPDWAEGIRPTVKGRNVEFNKTAPTDATRSNYCCYLETVFRYATVYSLWKDTRPADDLSIEAGDVFVRVGRPGHVVMVLDVATDAEGRVRVLLGQGGKPVQTFHVLRHDAESAWFPVTQSASIDLGEKAAVFRLKDLRHWGE